jgi:hypothetical protein
LRRPWRCSSNATNGDSIFRTRSETSPLQYKEASSSRSWRKSFRWSRSIVRRIHLLPGRLRQARIGLDLEAEELELEPPGFDLEPCVSTSLKQAS